MPSHLRLVVDLQAVRSGSYREGILYVDGSGRGWFLATVGCAPCVDNEGTQTLAQPGPPLMARCAVHGPLVAIPYFCRREYTLRIGEIERTGYEVDEDELLVPEGWDQRKRQDFISALLAEAEVNPAED